MGSSFSMVGGGMSPEDVCAICTEAGPDEDTGLEQVLIARMVTMRTLIVFLFGMLKQINALSVVLLFEIFLFGKR